MQIPGPERNEAVAAALGPVAPGGPAGAWAVVSGFRGVGLGPGSRRGEVLYPAGSAGGGCPEEVAGLAGPYRRPLRLIFGLIFRK